MYGVTCNNKILPCCVIDVNINSDLKILHPHTGILYAIIYTCMHANSGIILQFAGTDSYHAYLYCTQ